MVSERCHTKITTRKSPLWMTKIIATRAFGGWMLVNHSWKRNDGFWTSKMEWAKYGASTISVFSEIHDRKITVRVYPNLSLWLRLRVLWLWFRSETLTERM